MEQYQVGTSPVFTATFTLNNVPTSPTDGSWKIEKPDGTEETYAWGDDSITIVSPGVVQFQRPTVLDKTGFWYVRAEATAPFSDAWEEQFEVLPSAFVANQGLVVRYCSSDDILVGDMTVSPGEIGRYVNLAADEMDAEIGIEYDLPINLNTVPLHVRLQLKKCNLLIATGRLILSRYIGGTEDESTHGYGTMLLRDGQKILKNIVCGNIELQGVNRRVAQVAGNGPSITNYDKTSAVDSFYANKFWSPGQ